MFKRNKSGSSAAARPATPRGRGTEAPAAGRSPLARRFDPTAEPDTVDLADPGRFHAPSEPPPAEPDTRVGEPGRAAARAGTASPLLTRDAATGKIHLHPGEGVVVLLNGHAVESPTELRRGDRLEIGGAVFEFLA